MEFALQALCRFQPLQTSIPVNPDEHPQQRFPCDWHQNDHDIATLNLRYNQKNPVYTQHQNLSPLAEIRLINKEKDSVLKELKKLRIGISGYGKLTSDGDKNFIDLIE